MAFAPVTFTRIDAGHYVVGAVHLVRTRLAGESKANPTEHWEALPFGDTGQRPLFTGDSLEAILDMAHGAVELMRPADPEPERAVPLYDIW